MTKPRGSVLARFAREEHGVSAIIVALLCTSLIGMTGFVVDLGHMFFLQSWLQSSTDSAALAGAMDVSCCTNAVTDANTYSSANGDKNVGNGVTVTATSTVKCLKTYSASIPCGAPNNANAVTVTQTATVPMWFLQLVGVRTIKLSSTATALGEGGAPKTADIMLVLDTTASMGQSDPSCSIAGDSKLQCAEAGVQTLLNGINPNYDKVGLMVFPEVQTTQVGDEYDCNSKTQATVESYYATAGTYTIAGLGNDYKTSGTSKTLNTASDIVDASGGGGSGCTSGLSAPGGVGTDFAGAVLAATTALQNAGDSNLKVMIILSDGAANSANASGCKTNCDIDPTYLKNNPTADVNECHQAIVNAQAATADGIEVYTVAYDATTTATDCSTDASSEKLNPCLTLQEMASVPAYFYADTVGGKSSCTSAANPVSELVSVFAAITNSLQLARLVPSNTT